MSTITIEVCLTDKTYDQASAVLEERGDWDELIESLLAQHLMDVASPIVNESAAIGELCWQRSACAQRLEVIKETINQLDSICCAPSLTCSEIKHLTLIQVAKQIQLEQTIAKLDSAIAAAQGRGSGRMFPAYLEAFEQDIDLADLADVSRFPEDRQT